MQFWDGLQCNKFASNLNNIRLFEIYGEANPVPCVRLLFMHTLKMHANELIGLYWKSTFLRIPDLNEYFWCITWTLLTISAPYARVASFRTLCYILTCCILYPGPASDKPWPRSLLGHPFKLRILQGKCYFVVFCSTFPVNFKLTFSHTY